MDGLDTATDSVFSLMRFASNRELRSLYASDPNTARTAAREFVLEGTWGTYTLANDVRSDLSGLPWKTKNPAGYQLATSTSLGVEWFGGEMIVETEYWNRLDEKWSGSYTEEELDFNDTSTWETGLTHMTNLLTKAIDITSADPVKDKDGEGNWVPPAEDDDDAWKNRKLDLEIKLTEEDYGENAVILKGEATANNGFFVRAILTGSQGNLPLKVYTDGNGLKYKLYTGDEEHKTYVKDSDGKDIEGSIVIGEDEAINRTFEVHGVDPQHQEVPAQNVKIRDMLTADQLQSFTNRVARWADRIKNRAEDPENPESDPNVKAALDDLQAIYFWDPITEENKADAQKSLLYIDVEEEEDTSGAVKRYINSVYLQPTDEEPILSMNADGTAVTIDLDPAKWSQIYEELMERVNTLRQALDELFGPEDFASKIARGSQRLINNGTLRYTFYDAFDEKSVFPTDSSNDSTVTGNIGKAGAVLDAKDGDRNDLNPTLDEVWRALKLNNKVDALELDAGRLFDLTPEDDSTEETSGSVGMQDQLGSILASIFGSTTDEDGKEGVEAAGFVIIQRMDPELLDQE